MTQITSKQIEANKTNSTEVIYLHHHIGIFVFASIDELKEFSGEFFDFLQDDNAGENENYDGSGNYAEIEISDVLTEVRLAGAFEEVEWSDAALALLVEPTPDYVHILECLRNRNLVRGYLDMSEEDAIEQAFSHEQDPVEYKRLAQTVADGHEFFNDYNFHAQHRTPVYIRNDAPANALAHEYQSAGYLAQGGCHRLIYITVR